MGVLAAGLVLAHLAFRAAPADAQAWLLWTFALTPARFAPAPGSEEALRFVSAAWAVAPFPGSLFLHAGLLHLAFNTLFLVQAGVPVARRFGGVGVLALFFGSGAGGGLAYLLANHGSPVPAIGASGAVCGLFAALFLGERGGWGQALRDKGVRAGVLVFIGINVGLAALARSVGVPIAWEAHLGGFLTGAALAALLARGAEQTARRQG